MPRLQFLRHNAITNSKYETVNGRIRIERHDEWSRYDEFEVRECASQIRQNRPLHARVKMVFRFVYYYRTSILIRTKHVNLPCDAE